MRPPALWAAVLLSACFEPRYPPGNPCAEDGWCPPGQVCNGGVCQFPGFPPPPPPSPPDAAPPDAIAREDARLAALVPWAGALDPSFQPDITNYELTVSQIIDEISWEARPNHPEATVSIKNMAVPVASSSERTPVIDGRQEILVEVTAPAGNTLTYTVTVTREVGPPTQQVRLKAMPSGADDNLGFGVALWGDTLAVGAPYESSSATGVNGDDDDGDAYHSGAVYVFHRGNSGWVKEGFLKPADKDLRSTCEADRDDCDEFGLFVALDGDTLAVGAYGDDSRSMADPADDSLKDSGAVYVFRRSGTAWRQEAYLKASNPGQGDRFGLRLALHGDTLIVGAPFEDSASRGVNQEQDDEGAIDSGAVYVFRRDETATWAQEAYLKASNTDAYDAFGFSVAVTDDLIAASAHHEDSNAIGIDGGQGNDPTGENSGAVYLFRRSGPAWVQEAYVKPSNTDAGDEFGFRVAASGGLVVVGARHESSNATGVDQMDGQNDNSASSSGAAYVFGWNGQRWEQRGYLKASNTEAGDRFGSSVAAQGSLVAVGAPHEGDNEVDSNDETGAVYLFRCAAAPRCVPLAYLKAQDAKAQDQFGLSVSLGPNGLLVGAPFEGPGDGENSGAAYLFQ
jgi:hypothetical protein